MLNRKQIVDNTDALTVAQKMQIPMRQKGRYTYIICPGHEEHTGHPDKNFGSCVLKEHGYYCYAVKKYFDVAEMVQQQEAINGNEITIEASLKKILEMTDASESDYNSTNKNMPQLRKMPFSVEELNRIGLSIKENPNIYSGFAVQRSKTTEDFAGVFPEQCDENTAYNVNSFYLQKVAPEYYSLKMLYNEQPQYFLQLLLENCDKTLSEAEQTLLLIRQYPFALNVLGITQSFELLENDLICHIKKVQETKNKIINMRKEQYKYGYR